MNNLENMMQLLSDEAVQPSQQFVAGLRAEVLTIGGVAGGNGGGTGPNLPINPLIAAVVTTVAAGTAIGFAINQPEPMPVSFDPPGQIEQPVEAVLGETEAPAPVPEPEPTPAPVAVTPTPAPQPAPLPVVTEDELAAIQEPVKESEPADPTPILPEPEEPTVGIPVPVDPPVEESGPWTARYWNIGQLDPTDLPSDPGTVADVETDYEQIDFDWTNGSPESGVETNYWYAQFEREIELEAGFYQLETVSDDGVRVSLNDEVVLENWTVHAPTTDAVKLPIEAGTHSILVEYFEGAGQAQLKFELSEVTIGSTPVTPVNPPTTPTNPAPIQIGITPLP